MKKNIKIRIYFVFVSLLIFGSCTKDFQDINKNPNAVEEVPTAYLLTQAQRASQGMFNITGMLYSQLWSENQYTQVSTYETEQSSFNSYYSGPLADLQAIIDLNSGDEKDSYKSSGNTNNQIAIARIMQSWIFSQITDIWGDIPYSEALKGRGNFTPKYDEQSSIYVDLVKKLSESIDMLSVDTSFPIQGDIIYNGDVSKWKKFAASLILKLGVRMVKVDRAEASSAIAKALSYGVFESNSDNALYTYLADQTNQNPIYTDFQTRFDYSMSNILAQKMNAGGLATIIDPRLSVYAEPAEDPNIDLEERGVVYIEYEGKTYGGMPYGLSQAEAGKIITGAVSLPGESVRSQTTKGIIMTYYDVLFLLAEAAQEGIVTSGSVENYYENAIKANMEYWEIKSEKITAYINDSKVKLNSGEALSQIMNQKWVANYMQGLTAWSDWRQTNYPALEAAVDAFESRNIPRRRAYTSDEYNLNEENVKAAVSRQGEDNTATRIWWDKN